MVTTILFIGATGYIGGSVLTRILRLPDASRFEITALVRSEEKAKKLEQFGVKTALGSLDDAQKLEELAGQADVVFQCANADDLPATHAILRGLKTRFDATHKKGILIHTSGTGVLSDNAAGLHQTSTIYFDSDPEQIESLPPTAPHRPVDLAIVDADAQGYIESYIVLPSTIWGLASGPLVDAGIVNPHSIQIPALINACLDRGQAGMVGEGKNFWPNVNIDEVADLYIVIFDRIRNSHAKDAPSAIGHGREGFYFGENGEHLLYDVSKAIGKALVELGKATTDEPTTFTKAEIDKYFGGSDYLGSNSRCRAERSRAIGWKPVKGTKDMLASIKPEIEALLAKPKSIPLR